MSSEIAFSLNPRRHRRRVRKRGWRAIMASPAAAGGPAKKPKRPQSHSPATRTKPAKDEQATARSAHRACPGE
jgi:hypothetical protein